MTPAERSEINRQNAKKSTGPKTEEGKARSRMNAYRHGLRSEIVALETEDKAAVTARADAWREYYDPQSPAAEHLVTCCVRASLAADRAARYEAALLNRQVREASNARLNEQDDEVGAILDEMKTNPSAVTRLRRTAYGCRHMIERWEHLRARMAAGPRWSAAECDEAIRLQGADPSPKARSRDEVAFLTYTLNMLLTADEIPVRHLQNDLLHPNHVPIQHQKDFRIDCYPTEEGCRKSLLDLADDELDRLRKAEAELREWFEEPEVAEADDRALVVADPNQARLLLRYQSEARTAFTRAYRDLQTTLRADAAREEAETVDEPAATPQPEPEPAASPNEPKSEAPPHQAAPSATPATPRPPLASPDAAPEPPTHDDRLIHAAPRPLVRAG